MLNLFPRILDSLCLFINRNASYFKHEYRREICINPINFTKNLVRTILRFLIFLDPVGTLTQRRLSIVPNFTIIRQTSPHNRHLSKFSASAAAIGKNHKKTELVLKICATAVCNRCKVNMPITPLLNLKLYRFRIRVHSETKVYDSTTTGHNTQSVFPM